MIPVVRAVGKAAAAAFDINTMPKKVWLDASDYSAGTRPASFTDAVGNTITHGGGGNVAVVNSGGIFHFAFTGNGNGAFSFTPPAGSCDMWVVGTPPNTVQAFSRMGTAGSNSHWTFSGDLYDETFAATRVGPLAGVTTGVRQLLRSKTAPSGRGIWVNGTSIYSAAGTSPSVPATAWLGCGPAYTDIWTGQLNELIILDAANSTTGNEATIKAYLSSKYSLTIA